MFKKSFLFIALLVIVISCKNNTEPKEEIKISQPDIVESTACNNEVPFGNTIFCLPEIDGITECYKHPKVNLRADEIEDPDNTTLGYYLNNETFAKADEIETINYDDYYKVYAPNVGMDYNMTTVEMKQVMSMMSTSFINKTLEETNEDIKNSGKEVQLSQPILIEKYDLNDRSSTLLVLMRISGTNVDKVMALSMSSLLVKERHIFVAHYLDYQDEKTINRLKENTSTYIKAFQKANT